MKRLMTDAEYAMRGLTHCPVCHEQDLNVIGTELAEGNECTQRVTCHKCSAAWTEVYTFARIESIENDEGEPIYRTLNA